MESRLDGMGLRLHGGVEVKCVVKAEVVLFVELG